MRPRLKRMLWFVPAGILGGVVFVAAGGWIVMELWNWLTPSLFGWRTVTFWQALGLLALSRILVGGHGFRGGGRSRCRHHMEERWERMTPEERERFRQGMRERWGSAPPAGGSAE